MKEITNDIQLILTQIRLTLTEITSKKSDTRHFSYEYINMFSEKLDNLQKSSSGVFQTILIKPDLIDKMKQYLYKRLRSIINEHDFDKKYMAETIQPKETYYIFSNNLPSLTKEILQSIKSIEEQMSKLKQNLANFETYQPKLLEDDSYTSHQLSLRHLLKMIMEVSDLELEKEIDQMLFRLYILEESITLILHKTEHVFAQTSCNIFQEQDQELDSQRASAVSNNTKRSALSQSLRIYTINKKKQEQRNSMQMQETIDRKNYIKTDYQVCRKKQKKIGLAQKKVNCFCF